MSCKTLHLTNAYHPTSGGIRTFYRALLREANQQQRPMRLIVPSDRSETETVGQYGRIYHLRTTAAPAFDRRYRFLWPVEYLRPNGRIAEIVRDERPDLIEICDKYSLFYFAAVLRRHLLPRMCRPVLVGLSCERMDDNINAYLSGSGAAKRFAQWYIRHVYGPPFDYHIANSDYTAAELRASLWDRAPGFIRIAPMGVDSARFDPLLRDPVLRRDLLARAGGTSGNVLLLYAGRLSPEKNVGLLLDMLERLVERRRTAGGRDFRLVVAGDGPLAGELRAAAAARVPGRTLFLGAVTDVNRMATYYASADVFIHPNPREPFGIAPLEAMASGVPVVLPNTGGVLSFATPDNASVVPATPMAFASAVWEVAGARDDPRLRNAQRTAQSYDWPRVAAQWFALYDELVHLHGSTTRFDHPGRHAARGDVDVPAAQGTDGRTKPRRSLSVT